MNRTMRSKSREKRAAHSPGLTQKKGAINTITFQQIGSSSCKTSNSQIHLIQNIKFPTCSPNIPENNTPLFQAKNEPSSHKSPALLNYTVSLANIKNLSLSSSLFIITKVLNSYISCRSSGQRFHFSLSTCYVTNDKKLIVQSDKSGKNQGQLDEAAIVEVVIRTIGRICGDNKFQDFLMFFKRTQSKFRCNFKYTISLIKSYCSCSKIDLKNTIQYATQKKANLRSFNNSLRFCSLRISRSTNARTKALEEMIKYIKQNKSQDKQVYKRQRNHSGDIAPQKKITPLNKNLIKSNRASKRLHIEDTNKYLKVTKQSQASTDFKASTFHSELRNQCAQSFTFNGKLPSPLASFLPVSAKTTSMDKQAELPEVQSQQESSENEKQMKGQKLEEKNNTRKLFEQNNWVKKYQNLFQGNNKMMQSIIEGKEQYAPCKTNPQNLGRLARVVVQSFLPQGGINNYNPKLGR